MTSFYFAKKSALNVLYCNEWEKFIHFPYEYEKWNFFQDTDKKRIHFCNIFNRLHQDEIINL